MENPPLRVSGHGGSTNRTFIVEDSVEDEFGQWATDEVTGERCYTDDERSQTIQGPPGEEKNMQRKRKGQRWIKRKWKSIPW